MVAPLSMSFSRLCFYSACGEAFDAGGLGVNRTVEEGRRRGQELSLEKAAKEHAPGSRVTQRYSYRRRSTPSAVIGRHDGGGSYEC